jgi:phospholipase/carboxylesterase
MNLVHTVWHPGTPLELFPTLFAFHGHGAHSQDLLGIAPFLAAGRVQVICPEAEFALQPGMLSYTWFDREPDGSRAPREFERVVSAASEFVTEACDRYSVDEERIALLGFSQGGGLAYRLGLAQPLRYRGVAALSTWLPDEAMENAQREQLKDFSVLVQHGTEDPMVESSRGRDSGERLRQLGIDPEYHAYPMQHQISADRLRDLSSWLESVLDLPAVPLPEAP